MKGIIGETVATVQRPFDLPAQVEHRPWPMVGGALLAGYRLGRWGDGHPSVAGSPRDIARVGRSSTAAGGDSQRYAGSVEGRNFEPQNRRCGSRNEHTP